MLKGQFPPLHLVSWNRIFDLLYTTTAMWLLTLWRQVNISIIDISIIEKLRCQRFQQQLFYEWWKTNKNSSWRAVEAMLLTLCKSNNFPHSLQCLEIDYLNYKTQQCLLDCHHCEGNLWAMFDSVVRFWFWNCIREISPNWSQKKQLSKFA